MVLQGFNTDFKYKGKVYHAQTEDNGLENPFVVTLLYLQGAILASKRTSYKHLVENGLYKDELLELMKAQHRTIMKEVIQGKYDGGVKGAEPETEFVSAEDLLGIELDDPEPRSLDQAIINFLDNFSGGSPGRR